MINEDGRIREHLNEYDLEYMKNGEKRIITTERHEPDNDYVFTQKVEIQKRVVDEDILFSYFSYIVNGSGTSWAIYIYKDGIFYEGGDQVVNSTAYDVEIPFGDTLTYRWSSNVTGEIGFGRSINLSLPAGYHLISLTVTDKGGLSTTASIEIQVIPITVDDDTNRNEKEFPIFVLIIIGIVVLLIIISLIVFILMRKKQTEEEQPVEEEKDDLEQMIDSLSPEEHYPLEQESIVTPEPPILQEQGGVLSEFYLPEDNAEPVTEPLEGPLTAPQEDVFGGYDLPQNQIEQPVESPSEEITEPGEDVPLEDMTEPIEEEETQIS